MTEPKASRVKRLGRAMKYQYLKLLRSSGGARKVAMGFAIGFGIEFLVIATAGVIYPFFILLVWLTRSSVTSAAIGHVIAKLTFLPIPLLMVGKWLGRLILPRSVAAQISHWLPHWMPHWMHGFLEFQLKTVIGMALISFVFGVITYPIVYYLYEANRKRRAERQSKKRALRAEQNGSS